MDEGKVEIKKSPGIALAIGVVVVVIVAVIAQAVGSKNDALVTDTTSDAANGTADASSGSVAYRDGTYVEDGAYTSPAGQEEIGVTLTLANGVVTDAAIEVRAENPGSKNFQNIVSKEIASLVVGKSIDDLELDKVSGSSLTPKGFNEAVAKIKASASM